jgi:hypothetical protein
MPSTDELLTVGEAPFSWFGAIPAAAGYLFEVVFCAVSLAIVWGAMAERTKLWVYFAFGSFFTLVYSVVSHWVWSPDGWLFSLGMQDFAGSTVVHYQGALAGLAGAILLGPRIGKFGADGKPNAIPGHNMAFVTLGVIILWFGWFGFNPGSTLSVDYGGVGFFAYVALNTTSPRRRGRAPCSSWLVIKKPDLSMMLNGAVAALVAITAACAFVAPWAAIVIGPLRARSSSSASSRSNGSGSTTRSARSQRGMASVGRARSVSSRCRTGRGSPPVPPVSSTRRLPPVRRAGHRPRRRGRVHLRSRSAPLGDGDCRHPRTRRPDSEPRHLEHGMWEYQD